MQIEVSDEMIAKAVRERVAQLVDAKIKESLRAISHNDIVGMLERAISEKVSEEYLELLLKSINKDEILKSMSNGILALLEDKMSFRE